MAPISNEKQPLLPSPSPPLLSQDQEPSLSQLQSNIREAQRAYIRAWSRTTSGKWHRRIILSVTVLIFSSFMAFTLLLLMAQDGFSEDPSDNGRVPLEAHIMSKCPDAKDCLHDLVLPVMQRVGENVDFKLSYIGRSTEHDDGVQCMHGESECLGNIIELCAAKLYPDPKIYLGFTMCLTREYQKIPERQLVEDCALEHGIDFEELNKCTVDDDGALAVDMLRSSFNRSSAAGVTKSCTIRLNNEVRCIRDGGKWTDCERGHKVDDLVKDIIDLSYAY